MTDSKINIKGQTYFPVNCDECGQKAPATVIAVNGDIQEFCGVCFVPPVVSQPVHQDIEGILVLHCPVCQPFSGFTTEDPVVLAKHIKQCRRPTGHKIARKMHACPGCREFETGNFLALARHLAVCGS